MERSRGGEKREMGPRTDQEAVGRAFVQGETIEISIPLIQREISLSAVGENPSSVRNTRNSRGIEAE